MEPRELCYLPATQLAAAIRTKELSAVEACDAMLYRIRHLNPKLNVYCTLTAEAARTAARAAETAVMRGEALGPLHGVPFSVNDLTPTQGIRTTFGSKIFEHDVPHEDAIVVERLRAAGGVLLGKTNTPEFGCKGVTDNRVFGTTYNPWHLDRTPGGSSGGAGASVAAGMGTLAEGNDLAGSLRMSASFCGVVGFKPSQGRIPRYPNPHGWNTLHGHGPLTRTVADAALMFQSMVGPDPRDPLSLPDSGEDFFSVAQGDLRLKGLRVAWSPDLGGAAPVAPEVEAVCARAAQVFGAFGCHLEEASPDAHDAHDIFTVLHASLRTAALDRYTATWSAHMDPHLLGQLAQGRQFTLPDVHRAEAARTALYHRVRTFFDTYDLLLLPTAGALPTPAWDGAPAQAAADRAMAAPEDLSILTDIFNLTGQPAISVPASWTPTGLPVGLQIVAPFRADALVLHAAAAFEAAQPWHHRRRPLDPPPPSRPTFSLNFA